MSAVRYTAASTAACDIGIHPAPERASLWVSVAVTPIATFPRYAACSRRLLHDHAVDVRWCDDAGRCCLLFLVTGIIPPAACFKLPSLMGQSQTRRVI
jgi:hypothetical protein